MKILEEVKGAKTIGIAGHIRPDGDCVGSCMGLYLYLKKALPEAKVDVYLEQPADIFSCIQDIDRIHHEEAPDIIYDVFIILDCAGDRLWNAQTLFRRAKKRINIDHHISNTGCGDINVIEPERSSTCELLYELFDPAYLDVESAKALYIGIIHDSGIFQYSNTSPRTLQIAAQLISFGFDFSTIIDETFYERTYVQNQVMGRVILESVLFLGGKGIYGIVNQGMMNFYQIGPKDLDGIVNQLRIVKGVECAVFMYETAPMEYKISMRSGDMVDVSKIAVAFGGGGHKKAAGCTMQGTPDDIIGRLSLHIEEQLKA